MKALTTTFKSISLAGVLGSAFVLAGITHDMGFNSSAFMNDQEVQYASRLDVQMASRYVASEGAESVKGGYWPVNAPNLDLIEGEWEIRRIYNEGGKSHYNALESESKVETFVEMIGTNKIRLDRTEGLSYKIVKLNENQKTMIVYREYNGENEVVELKKLPQFEEKIAEKEVEKVEQEGNVAPARVDVPTKGIMAGGYYDLVVDTAVDGKNGRPDLLRGPSKVRGFLRVDAGEIREMRLEVLRGKQWKVVDLTYVRIQDGGFISSGRTNGILTNSGEDRFKVRFSTGPLAKVNATFVTREKMEELKRKREEQEWARARERDQQREDNSFSRDGGQQADNGGFIPPQELPKSVKVMQKNVKNSGFSFASGKPSADRKPASL